MTVTVYIPNLPFLVPFSVYIFTGPVCSTYILFFIGSLKNFCQSFLKEFSLYNLVKLLDWRTTVREWNFFFYAKVEVAQNTSIPKFQQKIEISNAKLGKVSLKAKLRKFNSNTKLGKIQPLPCFRATCLQLLSYYIG